MDGALKQLSNIMKSGNFGHNNDVSYRTKYSGLRYKVVALWRRLIDFVDLKKNINQKII